MQIFVREPQGHKTLVYDCSQHTTLSEFAQWIQDRTMWPQEKYYILLHGKIIPTYRPEHYEQTFAQLNIKREDTLNLMGRFRG